MAFRGCRSNNLASDLGINAGLDPRFESPLYAPIFPGMKGQERDPPVRIQDSRQSAEQRFESGEFIIHCYSQRLKNPPD